MPDIETTHTLVPMSADLMIMYSTPWCGYCHRLKGDLNRAGIEFVEVNIEDDPASADLVEKINGGNQTVPTILFPDGTSATNPSLIEVKKRLGISA
jgi:mycoredoxin